MNRNAAEAKLEEGWTRLEAGELEGAQQAAIDVQEAADALDDRLLLAEGLGLQAQVLTAAGELEAAEGAWREALELVPEYLEARVSLASLLAEGFEDHETALALIDDTFDMALESGEALPREVRGELHSLAGHSLAVLYQPREALEQHELAVRACPTEADFLAGLALGRFDLWDFEGAREAAQDAVRRDPVCAEGHYALGLVLERLGDESGSRAAFIRADTLDPEHFGAPLSLPAEALYEAADATIAALPERIRQYLANVPISIDEMPTPEECQLSDPPLSPGIIGRFDGTPLPFQSTDDPWSHFPARIQIYRRNFLRGVRNEEEMREQIEHTLLHEIGHFLGLDEDDLYDRGLE